MPVESCVPEQPSGGDAGSVAAIEFPQGLDAGGGDHAAVPGHDHLPEAEPVPDDLGDLRERGGAAGSPYSIWMLPFLPSREAG